MQRHRPRFLVFIAPACRRLLAGCALAACAAAAPGNAGAQAAQPLPAVHVNADQGGAMTEGSASYTSGSMSTATRFGLSPRETPQSAGVMTRQQLDDLGVDSLNDVVRHAPGLSLQKYGSERQRFLARGFPVDNIMYDGLPTSISTYTQDVVASADMAMFDHVELVRGATGLAQGAGNPSAAVNLVRKRPTTTPLLSLSGHWGSWDNRRLEVDGSGKLNASGSLRGRGVAAYQDKGSFQDRVFNRRATWYGILEADLGRSTTLSAGASLQNERSRADWGGLPTARDGSDLNLPRSTFLGSDWAKWDRKNTFLFGELEHRFDGGWKLRLAANRVMASLDMLGSYPSNSGSGGFTQSVGGFRYTDDQDSLDVYASGPFRLLGRRHELVAGLGARRERFDGIGDFRDTANKIDPLHWDPSRVALPAFDFSKWNSVTDARQQGAYLGTRLGVAESVRLILGARLDRYDFSGKSLSRSIGSATGYRVRRQMTRYAGLIHDLDDVHSVYASYTDIFKPQENFDRDGKVLPPIVGANKEIGIKAAYFEGALNASAALFQINQRNRARRLDQALCLSPLTRCFDASGEVESVGLDVEAAGALTGSWQIQAGYSYVDARYRRDGNPSNVGALFDPSTPAHLFKLSTSYRLPAALERWKIGGSAVAQSDTYKLNGAGAGGYRIRQGGYVLLDLMLGYRMGADAELRLNVNNVFDRRYYQHLGSNSFANVYGEPRSILLSARWNM